MHHRHDGSVAYQGRGRNHESVKVCNDIAGWWWGSMHSKQYRAKGAACLLAASHSTSPSERVGWLSMADIWLKLADVVERQTPALEQTEPAPLRRWAYSCNAFLGRREGRGLLGL